MSLAHWSLLITAINAFLRAAESYCRTTTLYAGTLNSSQAVTANPLKNDKCSINIRPRTFYAEGNYYLEISWSSTYFDVQGDMPLCNEAYVEVFLTRSNRSIGKFCSNNAGKPFTMYSRDGYARIEYQMNRNVTGKGFKFSYILKGISWGHLGSSPVSYDCYNTYNNLSSGIVYSTGWPNGYQKCFGSCRYRIEKPYTHIGTYVVFMDIDLHDDGYHYDSVQLFGSNSSRFTLNSLSEKMQNTEQMKTYTSYNKHTRIDFIRQGGTGVSWEYRGFVAGYIMFKPIKPKVNVTRHPWNNVPANDTSPTEPHSNGYGVTNVVVGILVPVIIIIFIVLFAASYKRTQQRRNANSGTVSQPLYTVVLPSAPSGSDPTYPQQPPNQTDVEQPHIATDWYSSVPVPYSHSVNPTTAPEGYTSGPPPSYESVMSANAIANSD